MTSDDLLLAESTIIKWSSLLIVPPILFSIVTEFIPIALQFDILAANFIYINIASFLAFRLWAYPAWEAVTRTTHMKQKLTNLSNTSLVIDNNSKNIHDIFSNSDITNYSLVKVLIDVTNEELDAIQKLWFYSSFVFVLAASMYSVVGFGEILKPLTLEKTAFLTLSLTTCGFRFWWPLFQARSRNLKHSRT